MNLKQLFFLGKQLTQKSLFDRTLFTWNKENRYGHAFIFNIIYESEL